MKIYVLSDIHLEFADFIPYKDDYDVVILAGDVHPGMDGLEWIKSHFPAIPVVYIAGNHEFYHSSFSLYDYMKNHTQGTNIHFLEQDSFVIEDVVILGTSLWTDFKVFSSAPGTGSYVENMMNDYHLALNINGERLQWRDTYTLHQKSRSWLKRELQQHSDKRKIVVTHHAPSALSLSQRLKESVLGAGYASAMDEFVRASGAELWVHGHIHEATDYYIGNTRILSNPKGYPFQDSGYNSELVIEV